MLWINDTVNSKVYEMGYDWLGRLTQASLTAGGKLLWIFNYTYSSIGNILSVTSKGKSTMYAHSTPAHAPSSITETSALVIDELSVINASGNSRTFQAIFRNVLNNTVDNINWTLDTGNGNYTAKWNSTLAANQTFILVAYHPYSSGGPYSVTLNLTAPYVSNSRTLEVSI